MKTEFTKEDLAEVGDSPLFLCKRNGKLLTFKCPACKKPHTHGAAIGSEGPKPFNPTHRVAHCHNAGGDRAFPHGYYVYYEE